MRSNHRPNPASPRPARLVGHFFRPLFGEPMIPIPAKAVIDLAVTVIATITSEVLAKRSQGS